MLKKLVKYGNSNALVLDKALLELLDIAEGSVVKIKTDGNSLIITPQKSASEQTIMPTINPQETLSQAIQQNVAQHYNNPDEYMAEIKKLYAKYNDTIKKINSPEYKQEILEIDKSFNGNRLDPEFGKAVAALHQKFAPELANMDQEMNELTKKYATTELKQAQQLQTSFSSSVERFKQVHEKYRHIHDLFAKLNENPEYINESVLLAEKYSVTKNSPEYVQEHSQLIAKYIPEWKCYQDELKTVGESIK